jgi:hypothetical protein
MTSADITLRKGPSGPPNEATTDLGCVLGAGMDQMREDIDLLTSTPNIFLLPRFDGDDTDPVTVVMPLTFQPGDGVKLEWNVPFSYSPEALAVTSEASVIIAPAMSLDGGTTWLGFDELFELVYLSDFNVGNTNGPLHGTAQGSILVTPGAFTSAPRFALMAVTSAPVDASNPRIKLETGITKGSATPTLVASHLKAGCIFSEPGFTLASRTITNPPFIG